MIVINKLIMLGISGGHYHRSYRYEKNMKEIILTKSYLHKFKTLSGKIS